MKTIKKYSLLSLITVAGLFLLSACNDKLEQNPRSQFASETFWTNEGNAQIALAGVYRGNIKYGAAEVVPTDWWTYGGLILLEHATDNAYDRRGANAPQNQLTNGALLPNNPVLLGYWSSSYVRIAICNNFLENIDRVTMNEDRKKRMKAEVRFIRASQYFYLSQHFGSVPLVKNSLKPKEANSVTKTPKAEIIKYVIDEYNACTADLPRYKDIPSSEFGRASKQANLAFLGRILLSEKRFEEAAAVYKQIIDFGDNIIDPNYESIFNTTNKMSKENIFTTQYSGGLAGNFLGQHGFPANKTGWHLINPLESLASQYDFTDGSTFSYSDPRFLQSNMGANRDPRFAASFLYDKATFGGNIYDCHPDRASSIDQLTYSKQATRTGYGLRKFLTESFTGDLKEGYGGNVPVIRYAEVLLSYLEAKMEAGQAIDQALLDQTINRTRRRPSVNMPAITVTNAAALRPILRKERRIELALEGIRFWDLLRWGTLGDVMQGDFWGASFKNAINFGRKVDPNGNKRWWVDTKAFKKGMHEVWPIPQVEQDINPNLR